MAQQKPVSYPNLVDQIKAVVDAHEAVHQETMTHAQEHRQKMDDKRKQLHVKHMAQKLIEGDGKS